MNKFDVIVRPLITEKSSFLGKEGKYIFEVNKLCGKQPIRKAVEEIFEVKVKSVNILRLKGKVKRFKGVKGKRAEVKKAIVTLQENYTIDLAGV